MMCLYMLISRRLSSMWCFVILAWKGLRSRKSCPWRTKCWNFSSTSFSRPFLCGLYVFDSASMLLVLFLLLVRLLLLPQLTIVIVNQSTAWFFSFDGKKMTQINKNKVVQKDSGLQIRFVSFFDMPRWIMLTWIEKQTVNSACASVALLNIINNIDGIDLGEELQHFKDFTMPFTPALRGDAIGNFKFVKQIHNSFGR